MRKRRTSKAAYPNARKGVRSARRRRERIVAVTARRVTTSVAGAGAESKTIAQRQPGLGRILRRRSAVAKSLRERTPPK